MGEGAKETAIEALSLEVYHFEHVQGYDTALLVPRVINLL